MAGVAYKRLRPTTISLATWFVVMLTMAFCGARKVREE